MVYENAGNTALLTYTIGGIKSRTVKRKDRPAFCVSKHGAPRLHRGDRVRLRLGLLFGHSDVLRLGHVILATLVITNLRRRRFQQLGVAQAFFHGGEKLGVYRAAAHTLVRGDADGQHALADYLSAGVHRIAALRIADGEKQTGVTKVVNVMVYARHADGGHVGDKHAGVKGQRVQKRLGKKTVAVQQPDQINRQVGKKGDFQQRRGQLDGKARVLRVAVFFNGFLHAGADVKNRIAGVKGNFNRVFLKASVPGVEQQGKAGGQLLAVIKLLVHDKAVDFGHLGNRAHVAGYQNFHKRDFDAFAAFLRDTAHQRFVLHVVVQKNLRVAAHGHEVGGNLHDGVDVMHALALGAVSKHGVPSFLGGRRDKVSPSAVSLQTLHAALGEKGNHCCIHESKYVAAYTRYALLYRGG